MFKKPEQTVLLLIAVLFFGLMVGILIGRHTGQNQYRLSDSDVTNTEQAKESQTETTPTGKLNINVATAKELAMLPGIGDAYAQRIIEYRENNGPFLSINDLMNVKGIGEKRFASISDYITVGG